MNFARYFRHLPTPTTAVVLLLVLVISCQAASGPATKLEHEKAVQEIIGEFQRRARATGTNLVKIPEYPKKPGKWAFFEHHITAANDKDIESIPAMPSDFQTWTPTALFVALKLHEKSVYGTDNRRDWYEVNNVLKVISESVAALVNSANLSDNGDGTSTLLTQTFKDGYRLCSEEKFGEQPVAAYGSAFLVGKRLLATAGHCVQTPDVPDDENVRAVFGFRMNTKSGANIRIANTAIFRVRVKDRQYEPGGRDWALLELERDSNRKPLPVRKKDKLPGDATLYVIGHPCGLPVKFAGDARITDNTLSDWFSATLDAYGGNSGSPVINGELLLQGKCLVEGVLVRGQTDFIADPGKNCNVSRVYPSTGSKGEDCTRTMVFSQKLHAEDTEDK